MIVNDPAGYYANEWRGTYAIFLGEISTRTMYNEKRKTYMFFIDGEVKILSLGFLSGIEVVNALTGG